MTDEEKKEIKKEWKKLINMSLSELKKWSDNDARLGASLSREDAKEKGIKSGFESLEAIIRKKEKLKSGKEWTKNDYDNAKREISFVSRMKGMKNGEKMESGYSKRDVSLRNWGHDPKTASSGTAIDRQNEERRIILNSIRNRAKTSESFFNGKVELSNSEIISYIKGWEFLKKQAEDYSLDVRDIEDDRDDTEYKPGFDPKRVIDRLRKEKQKYLIRQPAPYISALRDHIPICEHYLDAFKKELEKRGVQRMKRTANLENSGLRFFEIYNKVRESFKSNMGECRFIEDKKMHKNDDHTIAFVLEFECFDRLLNGKIEFFAEDEHNVPGERPKAGIHASMTIGNEFVEVFEEKKDSEEEFNIYRMIDDVIVKFREKSRRH
jgi:hypothetical protein